MRTQGAITITSAVSAAMAWLPAAAGASPHGASSPTEVPVAANVKAVTVSVDNGTSSLTQHSQTAYRIVVRNDSDVDYPKAFIAQMLPPSLSFGESQPVPDKRTENKLESARTSEIQWIRHLPAHDEITIDMTVLVGEKPDKGSLSTTACVLPDGNTRPLICDTDADLVSGGAFAYAWFVAATVAAGMVGFFVMWRRKMFRLRLGKVTTRG